MTTCKNLIVFLNYLVFFSILFSPKVFSCGDYLIHAEVKLKDGGFFLVINPQTQSEISLQVIFNEAPKLAPYKNRFIETIGTLNKEMEFNKGNISKLDSIKVLVPDLLASDKGTSMKLVRSQDCFHK